MSWVQFALKIGIRAYCSALHHPCFCVGEFGELSSRFVVILQQRKP